MIYYVKPTVDGNVILRESGGIVVSFVDPSEDNSDWQAYQEWLAEGNTPEPWPPAE